MATADSDHLINLATFKLQVKFKLNKNEDTPPNYFNPDEERKPKYNDFTTRVSSNENKPIPCERFAEILRDAAKFTLNIRSKEIKKE